MKFFLSLLLAAGFARCVVAGETSLEVLEEINLARTRPQQYAQLLSERVAEGHGAAAPRCVAEAVAFLNKVKPRPPLEFSHGLMLGAQNHVADQGVRGSVGHVGSDHSRPLDRIAKYGDWAGGMGENISYGYADAKTIVATLIVDEGVPDRGHRKNIFSPHFALAGVACGPHARYGTMCVIDFAGGAVDASDTKPAAAPPDRNWSAFDSLRSR